MSINNIIQYEFTYLLTLLKKIIVLSINEGH